MATQQDFTQRQQEACDKKIKRAPKKETKSTGKRKNNRKVKPDAILLKSREGKSYADALSITHRQIKPEDSGWK